MFPDSWDEATIRMKIREAYENGVHWKTDIDGNQARIGYTNNDVPFQFSGDFESLNGNPSIYANFKFPKK